ncbi:MAG: response regulator [Bacteroidota bacterium]
MIETIGVIEDHELTRMGICSLVNNQADLKVCWEAGSAEQAQIEFNDARPDLVLTDINLPNDSGVEFVKWLLKEAPDCPVIVISMYDYLSYVKELLELGVRGYVLKNEAGRDLLHAINAVREGESFYSASVTETLLKQRSRNKANAHLLVSELTNRERQIIAYVAREYSNKQIADATCLSVKTIENYKSALFQKIGVKNSLGLVRYAFENGIL